MQQINENTIQMDITYQSGERATLIGVRDGEMVTYFIDGEVVAQTSLMSQRATQLHALNVLADRKAQIQKQVLIEYLFYFVSMNSIYRETLSIENIMV